MKKIFLKRLSIVVTIFTVVLMVISFYWLKNEAISNMYSSSKVKMDYVYDTLIRNSIEIETLTGATNEDYLNRAESVAHTIEKDPNISYTELNNIAEYMDIDEINIFDENGVIIAATHLANIGASIEDGNQIGFFKPILENPELKMVQGILPSSIDGKEMQYIGVARLDKKGIVEIGMKPERMLATLDRTSIANVVGNIATGEGEEVFAIEIETGIVKGSTDAKYMGINFYESGLNETRITEGGVGEYIELENEAGFSVFRKMDQHLLVTYHERDTVLDSIYKEINLIMLCIVAISLLLVFVIITLLNKHVIRGVETIIEDLSKITKGNLGVVVATNNNPEFTSLSDGINTMVSHLLQTTATISQAIEAVDLKIGVYEYRNDMEKVHMTDRLSAIIGLSAVETNILLNDKQLFERKILTIKQSVYDDASGESIYCISASKGEKYIKISSHSDSISTLGVVVDVTDDVNHRNNIIKESHLDTLTGLFNRKGFNKTAMYLFSKTKQLKTACILMIDMDNLKYINDTYGHKMGDEYLNLGADVMKNIAGENHVVARLGGDEFAMIWYGYDNQAEIMKRINQMETAMHNHFILLEEDKQQQLSFSAGYVFYPQFDYDISDLLHMSDLAMYRAKQTGKGKFQEYDASMGE